MKPAGLISSDGTSTNGPKRRFAVIVASPLLLAAEGESFHVRESHVSILQRSCFCAGSGSSPIWRLFFGLSLETRRPLRILLLVLFHWCFLQFSRYRLLDLLLEIFPDFDFLFLPELFHALGDHFRVAIFYLILKLLENR